MSRGGGVRVREGAGGRGRGAIFTRRCCCIPTEGSGRGLGEGGGGLLHPNYVERSVGGLEKGSGRFRMLLMHPV